eukprot:scaffold33242_cov72-Skeletonema_dohrnii-CCMP3373.AAC.2
MEMEGCAKTKNGERDGAKAKQCSREGCTSSIEECAKSMKQSKGNARTIFRNYCDNPRPSVHLLALLRGIEQMFTPDE